MQTYTDGANSYTLNLTDDEMVKQMAFYNETNTFSNFGGVKQMGELSRVQARENEICMVLTSTQPSGDGMKNGMVMVLSMSTGDFNWLESCNVQEPYQSYDCAAHANFSSNDMWQVRVEPSERDGRGRTLTRSLMPTLTLTLTLRNPTCRTRSTTAVPVHGAVRLTTRPTAVRSALRI